MTSRTSPAWRARRLFLELFPGGFSDPRYLSWERDYKVPRAPRVAGADRCEGGAPSEARRGPSRGDRPRRRADRVEPSAAVLLREDGASGRRGPVRGWGRHVRGRGVRLAPRPWRRARTVRTLGRGRAGAPATPDVGGHVAGPHRVRLHRPPEGARVPEAGDDQARREGLRLSTSSTRRSPVGRPTAVSSPSRTRSERISPTSVRATRSTPSPSSGSSVRTSTPTSGARPPEPVRGQAVLGHHCPMTTTQRLLHDGWVFREHDADVIPNSDVDVVAAGGGAGPRAPRPRAGRDHPEPVRADARAGRAVGRRARLDLPARRSRSTPRSSTAPATCCASTASTRSPPCS